MPIKTQKNWLKFFRQHFDDVISMTKRSQIIYKLNGRMMVGGGALYWMSLPNERAPLLSNSLYANEMKNDTYLKSLSIPCILLDSTILCIERTTAQP